MNGHDLDLQGVPPSEPMGWRAVCSCGWWSRTGPMPDARIAHAEHVIASVTEEAA